VRRKEPTMSHEPPKGIDEEIPHVEDSAKLSMEAIWQGSPTTADCPPQPRGANTKSLYCVYAAKDEFLYQEFKAVLSALKQAGLISNWHAHKLALKHVNQKAVSKRLEASQLIVLLVSADLLAEEYPYGAEMRRALEKHETGEAIVVPIVLRYCLWHESPLGELTPLPNNERPIVMAHPRSSAWEVIAGNLESMLGGDRDVNSSRLKVRRRREAISESRVQRLVGNVRPRPRF
jgi:hypothetical protein